MEPNLKSHNVVSLEFSTSLPLSSDLVSKIRDGSSPDKDGDSVFFHSYKGHRALAVVKGTNKDSVGFEVEFSFAAISGGKLPKVMPRIPQLIDTLSSIKNELNFDCQVSFAFGKSLRPRPIISLPMKYIDAPNIPFDKIQGLHLVKLDGSETKYEIYLEAPTQGVLIENVIFRHSFRLDDSLANKILAEAESISNRFVSTEPKNAGKTK